MRTTPTCPMADLDICKHCRYSGNCEAEKPTLPTQQQQLEMESADLGKKGE